jgi:hypothetical protein
MTALVNWTDKIYAKNSDFVQREVAGECILIPVRRQLTDVNSLYVLNETGAALWRRMDGKTPLQAITLDFLNEFDVTQAQLEKDVASLIEDLLSIHAIREAGPGP